MKNRIKKAIIILITVVCILGIVQAIYDIPMWSL